MIIPTLITEQLITDSDPSIPKLEPFLFFDLNLNLNIFEH